MMFLVDPRRSGHRYDQSKPLERRSASSARPRSVHRRAGRGRLHRVQRRAQRRLPYRARGLRRGSEKEFGETGGRDPWSGSHLVVPSWIEPWTIPPGRTWSRLEHSRQQRQPRPRRRARSAAAPSSARLVQQRDDEQLKPQQRQPRTGVPRSRPSQAPAPASRSAWPLLHADRVRFSAISMSGSSEPMITLAPGSRLAIARRQRGAEGIGTRHASAHFRAHLVQRVNEHRRRAAGPTPASNVVPPSRARWRESFRLKDAAADGAATTRTISPARGERRRRPGRASPRAWSRAWSRARFRAASTSAASEQAVRPATAPRRREGLQERGQHRQL